MYPRLNYFRLFLAWSVLAFHSNIIIVPIAGMIAVWCFFFISGYLVSTILHGRYKNRHADFIVNRFLRIFPTYWFALAMGIIMIKINPEAAIAFDPYFFYAPETLNGWMSNLFIFGLQPGSAVVTPAWSLAIELNWYLILFIGSMLPLRWLLIFLSANLILPFIIVYFSTEAIYGGGAGFAFALGALTYHARLTPPKFIQITSLILLLITMFISPIYLGLSAFESNSTGVNYSLLGSVVFIYLAFPWLIKTGKISYWSKLAGEISYPFFLVHIFAIRISMELFDLPRQGWDTLAVSTIISLLLSLLIVKFIENPVAILRKRIRERDNKLSV